MTKKIQEVSQLVLGAKHFPPQGRGCLAKARSQKVWLPAGNQNEGKPVCHFGEFLGGGLWPVVAAWFVGSENHGSSIGVPLETPASVAEAWGSLLLSRRQAEALPHSHVNRLIPCVLRHWAEWCSSGSLTLAPGQTVHQPRFLGLPVCRCVLLPKEVELKSRAGA